MGVLDLSSECNASLVNSTLEKRADKKGGAIHAHSGTFNLTDVTLVNNKATTNGGVIEVTDVTLSVHLSLLVGNSANLGAIMDAFCRSANISATNFSNNSAQNDILEITHCNMELHNFK